MLDHHHTRFVSLFSDKNFFFFRKIGISVLEGTKAKENKANSICIERRFLHRILLNAPRMYLEYFFLQTRNFPEFSTFVI